MSSTKAERAWAGLNERQRLYLSTILDLDQAAEAEMKARSARWQETPPAAEWRQVTYDLKLPKEIIGYTSVQQVLRERGVHDTGSGSTLAALRRRELVSVTHDQVVIHPFGAVERIRVRLTTLGRAAARHGNGRAAPATPPRGLVTRWSFAALARLYAAGDTGLALHARGTPSWNTLLRLRNRHGDSFIEELYGDGREYRVRLSTAGRRHYEIHHACYRQLHPDIAAVDAPAPTGPVAGAHTGLDDHRPARRPRGLVRETDLPVLATLARLETENTSHLRTTVIQQHERLGLTVPDDVHAIPPGLLRWQVKDLTRTAKTIDRLTTHPDGPLIAVIDVPHGPFHHATHPTVPLIVLTDTGRAHYTRHLDDYRTTSPEHDLPDPPWP